MQLLKPVVKSLGWKLVSGDTDCVVLDCEKRNKSKRLQLCGEHVKEYRAEQHRLAQRRLNALRSAARRVARQAKKVKA